MQALLGFTYTMQQEALAARPNQSAAESRAEDTQAAVAAALHRIALSAQNLTEAEGAAIALGTGRRMVCVARTGILAPPLGTELDVRTGLAGDCVRLAKPAISSNTEADARVAATAAREPGVRSILYLPIRNKGRVLGILGVFASRPSHFSERDLSSLKFTEALVLEILQRAEEPQQNVLDLLLEQARISEPSVTVALQAVATPAAAQPAPATAPEARPDQNLPPQSSVNPAQDVPVPLFAGYAQVAPARTRSRWVRTAAVIVLVALALAAAVLGLHKMRKLSGPAAAPVEIAPPPAAQQALNPQPSAPGDTTPENVRRATWITPRVRFWSEPGHAVVTVTLDKAGEYQGQRLRSPDRVYFDIDENIVSAQQVLTFAADGSPVKRVRIAQFRPGISRIVFDLRDVSRYSSALASDPNRLVIDLYAQQPKAVRAWLRRTAPPKASAAREITVVVDPGHGGNDLGTVGAGGLQEKDLTLDVGRRLGHWLEQKLGAKVVYTRTSDEFVPLEQRVALANQAHANFFISIHANGSSYHAVHGVETFYFNSSADALESASQRNQAASIHSGDARLFAADVQHALLTGLSDSTRAMPDRGIKPAHFVVLRGAEMPAVLAEISFVTSADDERRLRLPEYRERVAKALSRGIASHVRRQIARSKVATLAKAATASQP